MLSVSVVLMLSPQEVILILSVDVELQWNVEVGRHLHSCPVEESVQEAARLWGKKPVNI